VTSYSPIVRPDLNERGVDETRRALVAVSARWSARCCACHLPENPSSVTAATDLPAPSSRQGIVVITGNTGFKHQSISVLLASTNKRDEAGSRRATICPPVLTSLPSSSMACAKPSSKAPALDLPMEILLKIFDDLPLPDLVRGSHVSRNWRRAARSHSVYWSDINFTANHIVDSELWLLSSRLRSVSARLAVAPEGRTVNLSLGTSINCYCLYGTAGSDCVGDFCRGPLRKYLPVIQRLVVNYSDIVLGAVADALSAGSTRLQFLELSAGFNLLHKNSSVRLIRRIVSFLRRTSQAHTESYFDVHPQSYYLDRQLVPGNLHTLMPNLCTLRLSSTLSFPKHLGKYFRLSSVCGSTLVMAFLSPRS